MGGGEVTYHLGLGRRLRLYTLSRERLLFDSRFVPPYAGSPENQTVLYALLRGELVWRAPHEHLRGPALLRLRLGVLHGELDRHLRSFYNYGAPLHVVALHVPHTYATPPAAENFVEAIQAPQQTFDAFSAYHALTQDPLAGTRDLAHAADALVETCCDSGVLSPEARGDFAQTWDPSLRRIFLGVRLAQGLSLNLPSLIRMSAILGISARQLTRDLASLASALATPNRHWRATIFDWRLRLATTLLSAPNATVTAVAHEVGYGSVEAMGRAFRDAQLPSPTAVRTAMLATVAELEQGTQRAGARHDENGAT